MLPVVVLAGGLGTRLRPVTGDDLPKVLVPVGGRPFIDYKLAGLARQGFEDVVLCVGTLADLVEAHVGDGSRYALRVRFLRDGPTLRGTGGAVLAALPLVGDAFWVTYGDTFLQLDVGAAERSFTASGLLGLMTVLHNENRLEPSNVRMEDELVVLYTKDAKPGMHEHLDYGMVALRRAAFEPFTSGEPFDLGAVFTALASRRQLGAFEVYERFYDVGTLDALRTSEAYFAADRTWERLQAGG